MKNDDLKYKIASAHFPHIGLPRLKQIVAYDQSVMPLFSETEKQLSQIPGISKQLAKNIISNRKKAIDAANEELHFIKNNNLKIDFFWDDSYSRRLKHCNDAPIYLYNKGNCNFNGSYVISIVGTRKATAQGKRLTHQLVSELKEQGITPLIVSGLAYGIDYEAHMAAIENGLPTVAVLGHHLGMLYPATHRKVAEKIVCNGALLSEFSSISTFHQTNFVRRNRIVAGMADATVVIESATKGGSLITAEIANSYNRDVFAFPGRPADKLSQGCNNLIKTNQAALIESAKDLIDFMRWSPKQQSHSIQTQLFIDLSVEEQKIIDFISPIDYASIDQISAYLETSISKTSAILFNLEMNGLIIALPGNRYQITGK